MEFPRSEERRGKGCVSLPRDFLRMRPAFRGPPRDPSWNTLAPIRAGTLPLLPEGGIGFGWALE